MKWGRKTGRYPEGEVSRQRQNSAKALRLCSVCWSSSKGRPNVGKIEQYEKSNKRWSGTSSQVPLPHHEGTSSQWRITTGDVHNLTYVLNISLWPLWTNTACVCGTCVYICVGEWMRREKSSREVSCDTTEVVHKKDAGGLNQARAEWRKEWKTELRMTPRCLAWATGMNGGIIFWAGEHWGKSSLLG